MVTSLEARRDRNRDVAGGVCLDPPDDGGCRVKRPNLGNQMVAGEGLDPSTSRLHTGL